MWRTALAVCSMNFSDGRTSTRSNVYGVLVGSGMPTVEVGLVPSSRQRTAWVSAMTRARTAPVGTVKAVAELRDVIL